MKKQSFLLAKTDQNAKRNNALLNAIQKAIEPEDVEDQELKITARQNLIVLSELSNGRPLTQPKAAKMFGIWRLGARVYDLRRAGIPVQTKWLITGQRKIAEYFIQS